jgi:hypothetical protein
MSQSRSKRARSEPLRYEDEQATIHYQQQEDRELQRAIQTSLEYDIDDSSDEDISAVEHDDEEEEEEKQEPETATEQGWSKEAKSIVLPSFTSPWGPQTTVTSPLDLFQLFLPIRLLRIIAVNTTSYAHSKGSDSTWRTTAEELYRFIAIHICMGIARLPQAHMYWSAAHLHPFISSIMARNRFIELLRYFYVTTPGQQQQQSGPLRKVHWFVRQMQDNFSSFYMPSQALTVDEAMVGYKGRSEMKQYIKNKPTKWGYKIWCLASSNYLLAFHVYEGKRSSKRINSPHDAVIFLTHNYQHRNHILYLDRGFTSPVLLDELLRRGIRCCGTVSKNRKELPKELLSSADQLEDSEFAYRQRGELGMIVWKDRRLVYLLTTHTSPAETKSIERSDRNGGTVQRSVPKAVADYNQHKSGVDTLDQLHASYSIGRRSKKWWPRLVWWLIDMCIINAYSLYQQKQQDQSTQLEFREQLMQQLVERYGQEHNSGSTHTSSIHRHHKRGHWPQQTEEERDCVCCSDRSTIRKQSRIQCELCEVHLCIDCFGLYHQQNN